MRTDEMMACDVANKEVVTVPPGMQAPLSRAYLPTGTSPRHPLRRPKAYCWASSPKPVCSAAGRPARMPR
jgi:hypothetical protein